VAAAFAAFGALCVFRAQALAARIRGLVVWGAEAVVLYLVFFPDAAR
jgi:hypothetical protein